MSIVEASLKTREKYLEAAITIQQELQQKSKKFSQIINVYLFKRGFYKVSRQLLKCKIQANRRLYEILANHKAGSTLPCCLKEFRTEKTDFPEEDIASSGACFETISSLEIEEVSTCSDNFDMNFLGGYFEVSKEAATVTSENGAQKKNLAMKKLKQSLRKESKSQDKIQKELELINRIQNPRHIAKYYKIICQ